MKNVILTIVLIIFVFSVLFLISNKDSNKLKIYTESKVLIFNVEIVKSLNDKAVGLSKYNSIKDNYGMLFLNDYDTDVSFWMKDMKFPIDIIFINNENIIVEIYKNNQPCINNSICPLITPRSYYRTVLEINDGLADRHGIEVGDKVEF